jgi:hypothetical protein
MTRIVGELDAYTKTIESARGTAELAARSTLFRTRGLSSDTSIRPDFAIDQAFDALLAQGTLTTGSIRRIAVIGPGLDFTDKAEGHDFYPQQTTQPFSVIESALRLGLSRPDDLRVTTFDLNPRVSSHLERARERARAGMDAVVVLPHDHNDAWQPGLMAFWKSFGHLIGAPTPTAPPPPRVDVRAVRIRPDVVLMLEPHDVNIVVERLVSTQEADKLDVVVATNVLVYYSVFEQSLALANIASMLRPGGVLLSTNVLVELPTTPLHAVGHSTTSYSDQPDDRDDIIWYLRQ